MKTKNVRVTRSVLTSKLDLFPDFDVCLDRDGTEIISGDKTKINLGEVTLDVFESIKESRETIGDEQVLIHINTGNWVKGKEAHAQEIFILAGYVVPGSGGKAANVNEGIMLAWEQIKDLPGIGMTREEFIAKSLAKNS